MTIKVLVISLIIVLTFKFETVFTQLRNDVNQYMIYQPLVNFASSNSYSELSSAIYYRNQWVGFNGAPVNYAAQMAIPVKKINSSFGVRFVRDEIGVISSDVVSLNYAYQARLTRKSYLSFSFSPKIGFLKENRKNLVAVDDIDPLISQNIQKSGIFNAELGAYYYRYNFYFGGALPNLLRNNLIGTSTDVYFDFGELEWFVHSGYEFNINSRDNLNVSTLIKSDRGASLHGELNVMYQINNKILGMGASYRTTNDLVAIFRFSILKQLALSYSYQYNFSNISNYQNGSHELMLVYELKTKKDLVRINAPRF
jgi:type IX secretion system PorP/SprF family membrane protein